METIPKVLPYGRFFGARRGHIELPGFSVSILAPALRPEDVPVHSHTDASFVFLLSGSYISDADGAPAICHPSTLIFNPAGITHRDRFMSVSGRFLTVSISRPSLHLGGKSCRLFAAEGNGGQLIIVIPDLDLVVGITGGAMESSKSGRHGNSS